MRLVSSLFPPSFSLWTGSCTSSFLIYCFRELTHFLWGGSLGNLSSCVTGWIMFPDFSMIPMVLYRHASTFAMSLRLQERH
ncbi:hypothetical protein BJV77DRAFT_971165 [Russula vinacea]|nr:hypothetical protein BJV77DRAFT_971165 [Russula vinacea]